MNPRKLTGVPLSEGMVYGRAVRVWMKGECIGFIYDPAERQVNPLPVKKRASGVKVYSLGLDVDHGGAGGGAASRNKFPQIFCILQGASILCAIHIYKNG